MQLVVVAAVMALVGAGHGCNFGCHLTKISIAMEMCGSTELIYTTGCEGQCYHEDPVYIGYDDWAEQRICNGDWTYEVKHIEGCPEGVTVPVARSCECSACYAGSTHCGRLTGHPGLCPSK